MRRSHQAGRLVPVPVAAGEDEGQRVKQVLPPSWHRRHTPFLSLHFQLVPLHPQPGNHTPALLANVVPADAASASHLLCPGSGYSHPSSTFPVKAMDNLRWAELGLGEVASESCGPQGRGEYTPGHIRGDSAQPRAWVLTLELRRAGTQLPLASKYIQKNDCTGFSASSSSVASKRCPVSNLILN